MSGLNDLKNFLEFKKTSVKSKAKLKDIARYLGLFINSTKKPINKFTEQDIIRFLNSLDYSIRTINDIKVYIKTFIKWKYPDWSARFRNLEKIGKAQQPPRAYTPEQMLSFEEVERIVKKENNLMWKTYWLVLFYGGFRPSEALRLKWEQVFFEAEGVIIKMRTSKTNKDFIKSLPKDAEQLLKELRSNSSSEYLFPSPFDNKKTLNPRTACHRLKELSQKALGKKVVPYQIRHSIATLLYKDDKKKDDDVANQMGHTKSMRAIYKNMSESDLKAQARKLWIKTKPLTQEERDKLKELEKGIAKFQTKFKKQKEMLDKFYQYFDLKMKGIENQISKK